MVRVFIMELEGKRSCVNATTDEQADIYLSQGAIEVPLETVKRVFGDQATLASPVTTSVDEDNNIIFTPPDFTEDRKEYLEQHISSELAVYDAALRKLNLMIRCAETEEELERLQGLYADWDAYAIQLMGLKERSGYPWDGGGSETPQLVRPDEP